MHAVTTHATSPSQSTAHATDLCDLERFASALDAIYDDAKAAVGPDDARAMLRLERLAGMCEVRGRRMIADAKSIREFARGIKALAAHYMMDLNNGHAIVHGTYDDVKGSRLDSATYRWKTAMVRADWAVAHNPNHHTYTSQVDGDEDYGFALFRVSGKTPWRPWHLAQPVLFLALSANMTLWLPTYPAIARARIEKRPVLSRKTFEPVFREVLAQWKKNYFAEPRKAGAKFPKVVLGNLLAKQMSNAYSGFQVAVGHHAPELLDFDADRDEPREIAYLRQILGSQNFTSSRHHEDTFALGTCNHIEHHLFPDLPIHKLREVEEKVTRLCEEHGIPHVSRPWPRALFALLSSFALYALPVRTTKSREKTRAIYDRLANELRAKKRARAEAPAPKRRTTTYELHLARKNERVPARSDRSLLESLELAGVLVPNSCRRGACKTCAVTKLSGRTSLERNRERTIIELCVARPVSDLVLDI